MSIKLFDSLARGYRELQPGDPDGVFRFYNCGPTVYAPAHIGNFRTFVINDVLRRMLELEFPGKVKHVRNLTDVDDRTIGQARAEGRPLPEITRKWTGLFHADCVALNCLKPHVEPTATGNIPEQVDMIDVLLRKGNAYRSPDGSVYFKISSFPGYGALSRIKERELKVTNTAFDADHKDDIGDFALWKAYRPDEDGDVRWPGPDGASAGRPGWHIECSAMIKKHLGETIDLHTGGVDLLFPHHENEIAQSQCCNGATFSRHWYHSEHLLSDGTTMSKSKGNYYTLGDLVAKGYAPMAVRYVLLSGHPRKQLNFTLDSLHAAESALKALKRFSDGLPAVSGSPGTPRAATFDAVFSALSDDLNTPAALGALFVAVNAIAPGRATASDRAAFERVLYVLGLELGSGSSGGPDAPPPAVAALASRRWDAKKAKDFAAADTLRAEIAAAGWSMLDGKDGYKLEPAKKA
jgi:cysteinyl-tRNA synthetase